ncbi:Hypothetical predicted protein [Octopus vulgaris]|uniref:Uncharacterized protein n=1 Tax=Octopus vulgaris TaxID=6645 RepID=A0AA36BYZ1_OCTVU|nr:Hypothetical predicted protein [Octopus vulgaris]
MDGDYDDDDFWETGISRPLKRSDSHVSAGNIYGKLDGSGDVDVGTVDGGTGPGGGGGSGVGSIGGDTSGGGIVMELTAATGSEQPGASAFQRKAKLRKSVMFSDDTWPIMSPTGRHSPGKHSGEEEEDGVDTEMAASGWAAVTTTTTSMTAVTHSSVGLSGTGRKKREIMTGKAARVSSDFDGGSRSGGGGGGASNSGTSGTSIFGSSSCDSNHSISRSNSSCSSSSSGSSNYSSSSSSSSSSSTCRCSNGSSDSGGGGKGVDDDNNNDDDDNHSDVDVEGGGDDDGSDSDGRDMILELQRLHQQQHSPRRKKTTSKQEEEEDEEGAAKSSRSNNSSRSSRQMRRRHSSQSGRQKLEETLTVDSLLEGHYGQLVKLCLEEIKVDDEASRRHIHARQMEQLYSTYIAVGNKQLALTPVALYPHGWPRYVTRRLFYPPPSSATPSMVQWECSRRGESGSSTTAFSTACSMSLGENEIRHERRNQRLLNGTRRVQNNRKLFRAKTTVGPQKSSVNPSSSRGIFDQHENIPTAPPPTAAATKPTSSAMSKKKLSGSSSTSSSGRGSFVRQKLPLQTASEENAANQTCRSVDNSFRPNDSNPHILKWLQKKDKDFWQQKREMKVRKKLETENRKLDAAFKADRQLHSSAAFEEWMHHKAKGKKFLSASSTAKSSIDVSQEPKQSPKPTYGFPFMSKEQHEGEGDDDAGVQEQTLSAPQKGSGFVKAGKSLLHEENLEVNFLRMTNLQNWQTKNPVSNFTSSQAETGTDVPLDNPESSTRFADCGVDQNKEELEIASKTEKHNVWQMKRLVSEHKKSSLIFQQPDEDNGRNQGKEQSFYGKPESQSSSPPTPLPLVMKKSTTRPKTAHGRRSRCSAATSRDKCLVSPQLMPLPSL